MEQRIRYKRIQAEIDHQKLHIFSSSVNFYKVLELRINYFLLLCFSLSVYERSMSLPKKLPPCNFFNLKDANYLLSSAHKPRAVMGKFTMMSDPEMIKEQSIYGPDAKWIIRT